MQKPTSHLLTRTIGLVCAVAVTLVATLALVSYTLVTSRFGALETKDMDTLVQRAVNGLETVRRTVEATSRDWAFWDDSYQFVQDGNQSFIDNNLSAASFKNLRANFLMFLDDQGQPRHGHYFDLVAESATSEDAEVTATLATTPALQLHAATELQSHVSGYVVTASGKPLVAAGAAILTSQNQGPIRGTLLMGRYLDTAAVERLAEELRLSLRLHPYNAMRTRFPAEEIRRQGFPFRANLVRVVDDRTVAGYAVLPDLEGRPALVVEVIKEREMYAQGMALWRQHALFATILGLMFLALLLMLLHRLVLRRLTEISAQVQHIANRGRPEQRLTIRGNDEISFLATRINAMLDGLALYRAAQKENEQYLKNLLDSISCGVLVRDGETRAVTDINQTGAEMLGLPPEEITGTVCHAFVQPAWAGELASSGRPEQDEGRECLVRRADGSELPVLKRASAVQRDGRQYLIESFIDIRSLKQTERELKVSEAKYRRFFEEDLTGDFISTPDGRILDSNSAFARMLGFDSVAEVLETNMVDHYFSAADRQATLDRINREGMVERMEWKLRHRVTGQPVFCIGNAIARYDVRGVPQEYQVYLFDDTRRVVLEKEMRQKQKLEAIGTLAGGIAHDFNNILGGIVGYTEIVLRDLGKAASPRIGGYLGNVLTACERARGLIRQILAFSRQSDMERRPVAMRQAVEDVIQLVRATLPATIAIAKELKSHSAVLGDQAQIHQVLLNLCTNAGHAMRETGGTLTLSLEDVTLDAGFTAQYQDLEPGDYVRIQVSDTGQGIPSHLLGRIFDPFFTTKRQGEGTGLGLSMVHGIVTAMKGVVTVQSTVGRGSLFSIFLPLLENEEAFIQVEEGQAPIGSERIVYIDDDAFLAEIGKQMLIGLGYSVTEFVDSGEALLYISEHQATIDLVITDMTMPGPTGLDLARTLRQQGLSLPVILCTGHSSLLSAEEAAASGIADVLLKPVTVNAIARMVRAVLDQTRGDSRSR